MVTYFNDYANLCFEKFGNQVKHWITFSDPWSHAKVWHSYDKTWRKTQQGLVGISLTCNWGEPVDITNPKDIEAAERYMQFCLGWFANPIYAGDYPQVMKEYIGRKSTEQGLGMSRLPVFSIHEKNDIKGTFDFLGLGHFTTRYITEKNYPSRQGPSYQNDRDIAELVDPNWLDLGSHWPHLVPWGFRRLLNFVQTQYGHPLIYVTENGVSEKLTHIQLCDEWRIRYLRGYINEMLKEPLLHHMQMVTEIVVPTVCTLCILISAVLLMILLRRQS
ncbi:lactase-like protein isoform X3 [Notamacropus eugenii]|uniref:lactase-like protein isoform X3 n=1 Tax=Notamacropus eugenii TaxID=9315 RepID=UPI003B6770D3